MAPNCNGQSVWLLQMVTYNIPTGVSVQYVWVNIHTFQSRGFVILTCEGPWPTSNAREHPLPHTFLPIPIFTNKAAELLEVKFLVAFVISLEARR